MIYGRSPALVLGLLVAALNLVVLGLAQAGIHLTAEFILAANAFFAAGVAVIANKVDAGSFLGTRTGL